VFPSDPQASFGVCNKLNTSQASRS
jgi:hypothetical protein